VRTEDNRIARRLNRLEFSQVFDKTHALILEPLNHRVIVNDAVIDDQIAIVLGLTIRGFDGIDGHDHSGAKSSGLGEVNLLNLLVWHGSSLACCDQDNRDAGRDWGKGRLKRKEERGK
jgi:hypothetical protein